MLGTINVDACGFDPSWTCTRQAAVRAASLRWHPDKFMSKYGKRIAPEDRSNIAKVCPLKYARRR